MDLNKYFYFIIFSFGFGINSYCQSTIKILFDATKAETAGNADWVMDADVYNLAWNPNGYVSASWSEANAQRYPTPSQTLITASTPETFWSGSLSNWGVDCAKKGYQVETLPYNGQITFGSTSNVQDLLHYKIFIVDEPNILFSSAEKTAMMQFVQNGGSLFIISDHTISDRNGDGNDSPSIWNDFITNNGVLNSATGFTFDLANISQTSSNIPNLPTDSILHGPMGNVTQAQWSNGTTMSLNPAQNASVKGVIYKTGSSFGNSNVFCAYSRVGNGKVAAIGDSSPTDDGTGDPNDGLYNGYTADAAGNHQRLLMNITIWLAGNTATSTNIKEYAQNHISVFPNPVTEQLNITFENNFEQKSIQLIDLTGRMVKTVMLNEANNSVDLKELNSGIYILKLFSNEQLFLTDKLIKAE